MRFELPEQKKLTLEMVIPIRWGDMDAMGHVNNTIYIRYLEIIRIEWLHQVYGAPDVTGEGPVIVNTFCNFLRQLKYPGDVLAKHYVSDPSRSSFMAWVTLERIDEPGVLYATGGAKTVWVNYRKGRSVALPGTVRTLVAREASDTRHLAADGRREAEKSVAQLRSDEGPIGKGEA